MKAASTTLASTALRAVLLAGPRAASAAQVVDIAWDAAGNFRGHLVVAAGGFAELCGALEPGHAVVWQFEAGAPLDFRPASRPVRRRTGSRSRRWSRRATRAANRWRSRTAASLHAKIVIADRRRAVIGSINQDPRSRRHNTESWVTIESEPLASRMAALFDESTRYDHAYQVRLRDPRAADDALTWGTEDAGIKVSHDTEPGVNAWLRWCSLILSAVVPEDLL